MKDRPWLIVLLASSAIITLWAATRRVPPPPEPIPAVEQTAVEAEPEPEPEAAQAQFVFPEPTASPSPAPAAAPAQIFEDAPPALPVTRQLPDGTWGSGPAN